MRTISPATQELHTERLLDEHFTAFVTTSLARVGHTTDPNNHDYDECEFKCTGIVYDASVINADWEEELFYLYKAKAYTHCYIAFDEDSKPYKAYAVCINHDSGKETYKMDLTEVQATAMFMSFLKKHNF